MCKRLRQWGVIERKLDEDQFRSGSVSLIIIDFSSSKLALGVSANQGVINGIGYRKKTGRKGLYSCWEVYLME